MFNSMPYGLIYALIAFVAMMQIVLILNRTRATKYKEIIDPVFCRMLKFFCFFCFVDMVWGIGDSKILQKSFYSYYPFLTSSYAYHIMAALSAFMWFGYGISYIKADNSARTFLNVLRNVLIVLQLTAMTSNLWDSGLFFSIDPETLHYTSGKLRTVAYILQFSYYGILIFYSIYRLFKKEGARQNNYNLIIFSLVPLIFGVGQLLFSEVAMYSLGFMFSAFIIYSFNVATQREAYWEMKNNEQIAEAKRREAEIKIQTREAFLFNMSHDIRTPMNAVIGYTDLLHKYKDDSEKSSLYLERLKYSSQHLLGIINSVLEMSRINSGKVKLNDNKICDMDSLVDFIAIFDGEMKKKNLTLTNKVNIQHRRFYCDDVKVREIFQNIIGNAVKYTPEGGHISLLLEEIPSEKNGYYSYKAIIEDDGVGMSKEFLPHIFESFEREKTATDSKIVGTGLGMAIVKEYVDIMGGKIDVESEFGKGTKITVILNHRIPEDADEASAEKEDEVVFNDEEYKNIRILLAEDNEFNSEIATELLTDFGFKVDCAADGAICIEKLKTAPAGYYDLILMDIQMPIMDGYTAASEIRKFDDENKRSIPIIAMTANVFESDQKRALEAGMNDFLGKPIDINAVKKALHKWLNKTRVKG